MIIDSSHKSPNSSSRNDTPVRLIVLHATVGSYTSSLSWLCEPISKVSIHYLIDRNGHVDQLVQDDRAAWHAGKSAWLGLNSQDIEESSLGIELVNANTGLDPYPAAQLGSCRDLCRAKIAAYHIQRAYVVRHLDIATPKGRKTDPAGFPWPQFLDSLYAPPLPSPQPGAPSPLTHYRVRQSVTSVAVIRAYPRVNGAVLGSLRAGQDWYGEAIEAKTSTFVKGFGSSRVWVRDAQMRFVWSGLLEKVNI
jgi:N-acetyl-anhydromuramyl-L-alanine amidase AmpD